MFLKCSIGTRGEGDSQPGLSWNSRSKTKLGSFWQRGKVKTQAESRAPSVLYQCFEGLDEGNRKIQEILSKKSQAVTPVSHRDFWFCSAKSSQDYFELTVVSRKKSLAVGLYGRSGLATAPEGEN